MKYMFLIYSAEDGWTDEERKQCMLKSMGISGRLASEDKCLDSSPLHSVTTATSVRVRDGKRLVMDGPFAETTEQLGGYYILDLETLQEAIDVAAQLPPAQKGTVEIRPLLEIPDSLSLPPGSPGHLLADAADSNAANYILLMYAEEGAWPAEDHAVALAESVRICHELHERGEYLSAAPLQPPSHATCVQVRSGKPLVSDGPFSETKEQLGGYFLIRVRNLDEAIAIAARIPGTHRGTAEIRPLQPLPQMEKA